MTAFCLIRIIAKEKEKGAAKISFKINYVVFVLRRCLTFE